MKNIRSLCIRFNLLKDRDKSVWDILHSLDKKKWKSYSSAVITSVADFFNRQNKIKDDPYFETREREEKFARQWRRFVVFAAGIMFINHLHIEICLLCICQTIQRSRIKCVLGLFGI